MIGGEDNRVRKRCLHFEEKMEKKNWDCKESPRRVNRKSECMERCKALCMRV